jgi:hypothetical protein
MLTITPATTLAFAAEYTDAIYSAAEGSLSDFRATLVRLLPLSAGALGDVALWTEKDFAGFQAYCRAPRLDPNTDEEVDRFGFVVTPLVVLLSTIWAAAENLTWGAAYLALLKSGALVQDGPGVLPGDPDQCNFILGLIPEEDD